MGEVKWSEKSAKNLKAIYEYISKDSTVYASHFIKSLVKATEKLEIAPLCGRIVSEFEEEKLREVIYGNYRIVYRVEKEVEIIAVIHGARDFKKALKDEWEL